MCKANGLLSLLGLLCLSVAATSFRFPNEPQGRAMVRTSLRPPPPPRSMRNGITAHQLRQRGQPGATSQGSSQSGFRWPTQVHGTSRQNSFSFPQQQHRNQPQPRKLQFQGPVKTLQQVLGHDRRPRILNEATGGNPGDRQVRMASQQEAVRPGEPSNHLSSLSTDCQRCDWLIPVAAATCCSSHDLCCQQHTPHQSQGNFQPQSPQSQPQPHQFQPQPHRFQPQTHQFQPHSQQFQPQTHQFQPHSQQFQPQPQQFQPQPHQFQPQNQQRNDLQQSPSRVPAHQVFHTDSVNIYNGQFQPGNQFPDYGESEPPYDNRVTEYPDEDPGNPDEEGAPEDVPRGSSLWDVVGGVVISGISMAVRGLAARNTGDGLATGDPQREHRMFAGIPLGRHE